MHLLKAKNFLNKKVKPEKKTQAQMITNPEIPI
jgi:hypothetical protein